MQIILFTFSESPVLNISENIPISKEVLLAQLIANQLNPMNGSPPSTSPSLITSAFPFITAPMPVSKQVKFFKLCGSFYNKK